ncbi:efflux RND transporter periplasmic adaptor subunit [Sulfitobacter albidus]|uniref:Efflux RND transporter periplasmic adaptor subunit n=1 Tax=Sulfitobacter albidus TaxID=2829501 RepID=A0A975PL17_9RHOB|nr:efflux RND transporter periplasmic adaptor subunit [Sulfitobacter albidus]QUJ75258.1 efflux RND transporter periplasmic adaptor subunit [Sulfitobacter albidus]
MHAQQQAVPVEAANPVQQRITDYDIYTGRVEAAQEVDIRARVSGFLREIRFEDGALVTAGDILFVLDKRRAQASVGIATAALALAEANRDLAAAELARAEELASRQAISRQDRDQRAADLAAAEATVEGATADLELARIDLTDTEVTAPFDGRVSSSQVDIGALVDGGSGQGTLLTDLVSVDPVEIVFDAAESDYLSYVRLDLAGRAGSSRAAPAVVDVMLPDEDTWQHKGQIDFIDNRIDAASGTIRVRAKVPNANGLFAPGLFAQARVPRSEPYAALLVPDTAVLTDQAGRIVYVVTDDGTAQARAVTTGVLIDGLRVIRSGLDPEDRVIQSNLVAIRSGVPVEVMAPPNDDAEPAE